MYQLSVDTPVYQRLKKLPGNARQRIRRQITDLANNPRPYNAKQLNVEGIDINIEYVLHFTPLISYFSLLIFIASIATTCKLALPATMPRLLCIL